MFCTNCGVQVFPNAKFCEGCGFKVETVVNSPDSIAQLKAIPPAITSAPSKNKITLLLPVLLLFTMAAGVVWFFDLIPREEIVEPVAVQSTAPAQSVPASVTPAPVVPVPAAQAPPGSEPAVTPAPTPPANPEVVQAPVPTPPPPVAVAPVNPPPFGFPGTVIALNSTDTVSTALLYMALLDISHFYNIRPLELTGNNVFGYNMLGAVVDFQVREGLPGTGIVDETTWYAIMHAWANPPATPDPVSPRPMNIWHTTLVDIHMRQGPSSDTPSAGLVPQGSFILPTDYVIVDGLWWYLISWGGQNGFISARFLMQEGLMN